MLCTATAVLCVWNSLYEWTDRHGYWKTVQRILNRCVCMNAAATDGLMDRLTSIDGFEVSYAFYFYLCSNSHLVARERNDSAIKTNK